MIDLETDRQYLSHVRHVSKVGLVAFNNGRYRWRVVVSEYFKQRLHEELQCYVNAESGKRLGRRDTFLIQMENLAPFGLRDCAWWGAETGLEAGRSLAGTSH